MINSLSGGSSLVRAVENGKLLSEVAIRIWNQQREWQVHRWDKCCHTYLDGVKRRILK